jgi:hypothetical protein
MLLVKKMPHFVWGTTIITFVTSDGIVMAADSLTVDDKNSISRDVRKIYLIQDRILVSTAWLTQAKDIIIHDKLTNDMIKFNYNFIDWIDSLAKTLPKNVTVSQVSNIILYNTATTFSIYNILLKLGKIKRNRDVLVRYYIAGYEENTPVIYKVDINIDWQNLNLVGPFIVRIFPSQGSDLTFFLNVGATHEAIDQILMQNGPQYKKAIEKNHILINKLLFKQNLNIDDSINLCKILIQIESEFNPTKVGMPINIGVIPKNGKASISKIN